MFISVSKVKTRYINELQWIILKPELFVAPLKETWQHNVWSHEGNLPRAKQLNWIVPDLNILPNVLENENRKGNPSRVILRYSYYKINIVYADYFN